MWGLIPRLNPVQTKPLRPEHPDQAPQVLARPGALISLHPFRLILLAPLACLVLVGGCRNAASERTALEALRPAARPGRQQDLRGATIKNGWAITGWDAQHRPAWRLRSRETRIRSGNADSPTRATLLGARAELFREGVLQSSFEAERIEFTSKDSQQSLVLSEGVRAQSTPPQSVVGSKGGSKPLAGKVLSSAPIQLEAPIASVSLSRKTVWVPSGATIRQSGSAVQVSSRTLKADAGLERLDMQGDVKAASPQGRVRADRATYNWKSRRLLAVGHVRAQAPVAAGGKPATDLTLSGERLDADAAGGGGLLSGGVRAVAQDAPGVPGGAASAQNIRFNWREQSVAAAGGVSLQKDGATLRAQEISSDAGFSTASASGAVVFTAKDGTVITAGRVRALDKFTRAIASGGVRLAASTSSGPTVIRAAQVEAFDGFTRATASGGVTLQQGGSTVRAPSVQAFDLKGAGRATASGGAELVRDDISVRAGRLEATNLREKGAQIIQASGGVSARSKEGRVRAERARWAGGRVGASGGITLERGGMILRGDTLAGDDRFENALLTGRVRGSFQGGTVSASRIQKSGDQISATGGSAGVRAQQAGVSMRVGRLDTTASGDEVRGSGGVLLLTPDGATLRAPSARYSVARDEAYAEDGVRFVDRKNGLDVSGSRVIVRHVRDPKRREATISDVGGTGSERAVGGLKF